MGGVGHPWHLKVTQASFGLVQVGCKAGTAMLFSCQQILQTLPVLRAALQIGIHFSHDSARGLHLDSPTSFRNRWHVRVTNAAACKMSMRSLARCKCIAKNGLGACKMGAAATSLSPWGGGGGAIWQMFSI